MKNLFVFSAVLLAFFCFLKHNSFAQTNPGQTQRLFEGRLDYPFEGGWPNSIASADFNRDGIIDLAVSGTARSFDIFIGSGGGSFTKTVEHRDLGGHLITGDFNNDQKPDLAIAGSDSVRIALGNGDGTFQQSTGQPVKVNYADLSSGDFDKDGKLDLAAPTGLGVAVLLGNGDGTLQSPRNYAAGAGGVEPNHAVTAADFDRDGNLDLAVIGKVISIFRGQGDGTFVARSQIAKGFLAEKGNIGTADFNHDGKLDLVSIYNVYLGNGNGTFQSGQGVNGPQYPWQVSIADLDRDNNPDLVISHDTGVIVCLGNGNGTFQRSGTTYTYNGNDLPGLYNEGIAIADFDRDGQLDLAVGSRTTRMDRGFFGVLLGIGDGTFRHASGYEVGDKSEDNNAWGIAAADFDGDQDLDLVAIHSGH